MHIRRYRAEDLDGVLDLCILAGWPSFPEDPARAQRALTAPGVTTVVAAPGHEVIGFAQMLSDGEIQAYLALVAVRPQHRRQGIGRALVTAAYRLAGGTRVDLLAEESGGFYRSLPHLRLQGFRLYPDYSGPDRYRPGVSWKDGREISEG